MKVPKDFLMLQKEGRLTLQIPQFGATEWVELPDDWVHEIKHDTSNIIPCTSRQEGFLYFTEKGYKANEDAILDAYAKSEVFRGENHGKEYEERVEKFKRYAEKLFQGEKDAIKRKIKNLKAMILEYKDARERFFTD